MEMTKNKWCVADHKVIISIGPMTQSASRSSVHPPAARRTHKSKHGAGVQKVPQGRIFTKAVLAVPAGNQLTLPSGVRISTTRTPSFSFKDRSPKSTNQSSLTSTNVKSVQHVKRFKNYFNLQQYRARTVGFKDSAR